MERGERKREPKSPNKQIHNPRQEKQSARSEVPTRSLPRIDLLRTREILDRGAQEATGLAPRNTAMIESQR